MLSADVWFKYFHGACFMLNASSDLFQEMTSEEKSKITDLNKCNFSEMSEYFKAQSEARKQMSKEEKLVGLHSCTLSQP